MKFSDGNGHGKGTVERIPLGADHVVYRPGVPPPPPDEVPVALDQMFTKDLAKNPNARVRSVHPVVQEGQTIALHVFYDTYPLSGPPNSDLKTIWLRQHSETKAHRAQETLVTLFDRYQVAPEDRNLLLRAAAELCCFHVHRDGYLPEGL